MMMAQVVKKPPTQAGDIGDVSLIPGSGRSPRRGNGNPLQHSCLENPMERGAWWATVHGVATSRTRLSTYTHHQRNMLSRYYHEYIFLSQSGREKRN